MARRLLVTCLLLAGCAEARPVTLPLPDKGVAPESGGPLVDAVVPDAAPDETASPADMPATLSCALVCKTQLQAGTSDCSGAVTRTSVSGSRALFRVDLGQYQGILLTVEICDPSGWVLHVGNSPTNDGNGGDAGQFDNDSEAQLVGGRLTAYSNDTGLTQGPAVLLDDQAFVPAAGCSTVTALISDGKLETRTPKQHTLTSPYIFRLDQPDASGGPDSLIYVGLNRTVLLKSTRLGAGARSATFCLWK